MREVDLQENISKKVAPSLYNTRARRALKLFSEEELLSSKGKFIGMGATTDEVCMFGKDRIIKVLNHNKLSRVAHEINSYLAVYEVIKSNKSDLHVPKIYGLGNLNGYPALVIEYIKGKDVIKSILNGEISVSKAAQDYAKLLASIHNNFVPNGLMNMLPSQIDFYKNRIGKSELSPTGVKKISVELLNELTQQNKQANLVHNDFYFRNVKHDGLSCTAIDWAFSASGNGLLETADFIVFLESQLHNTQNPVLSNSMIEDFKHVFTKTYFDLSVAKYSYHDLAKAKMISAAERISVLRNYEDRKKYMNIFNENRQA